MVFSTPVIPHKSVNQWTFVKMCPDWRDKLSPPLHWLYHWRGHCVHHMEQGCSMGLRPASLLLPVLLAIHNQARDEVLPYQASAEVSKIPFPLLGKAEWGSGISWAERKSRGNTRWINIFNRGRDQAFIEWGQKEAFSHTYRFWKKTEMSVSWICFHCHGKIAMGQVTTRLLKWSWLLSHYCWHDVHT